MKSLYVLQESGEYKFELEYLNSHKCTVEELGLAEGEHKFWPIKKSNEKMLSAYSKGFHCVDPDALSIRGNYNSQDGQAMYFIIRKCTGEDYCKNDAQIKEYFAKRTMFLLTNGIRFDQQKYGEEAIIQESQIDEILLGSWQHLIEYRIQRTELQLQDLAIDLDEVTELQDSSVFSLK